MAYKEWKFPFGLKTKREILDAEQTQQPITFDQRDLDRARQILEKGRYASRASAAVSTMVGVKVKRADTILQNDKQRHLSLATFEEGSNRAPLAQPSAVDQLLATRTPVAPKVPPPVPARLMPPSAVRKLEEEKEAERAPIMLKGFIRLQAVVRGRKARAEYRTLGNLYFHFSCSCPFITLPYAAPPPPQPNSIS